MTVASGSSRYAPGAEDHFSPDISMCSMCPGGGRLDVAQDWKQRWDKYEFDYDSSTLIITEIDIGSNQLSNPILTIYH